MIELIKNEDTKEEQEEFKFICAACGYEQSVNEQLLGFNFGPIPTVVCPNCRTIQIPELLYERIHKQVTSNIIVP